ncbi:metabotropic glutamate receptor 3-like isoform X1 [Macrobrachium rosenbergii]|uniref:metabotropic glutamate receptor 3-like isoform X1 n=2 Tax=Macrobrachium rosenbergii TaxID=79674 RepID=UPI0034D568A6
MSTLAVRLAWMIFLVQTGVRFCRGACLTVADGEAYSAWGDAVITVLLPLHRGEHCDKISMTEVQILEATKIAVNRVNELDLVPGVKVGLRVVDTCGEVARSVKLALASLASDARSCIPSLSLGFLGPGDAASAAAVGKATRALQAPVVAYGPRTVVVTDTINLITPAPQRSAKAAVHVLAAMKVQSFSIVHTADEEGRSMAEHFSAAAEDAYRCVEMTLEAGDEEAMATVLQEGPGTIVILGTRDKAQRLARTLGAPGGPADLILMLDNAGPVPPAELESIATPLVILQRTAPTIPEYVSYLERDFYGDDGPRREYVAAMSKCDACEPSDFGYDASAPAAIAAVLVYAEALREAQVAKCGTSGGLCNGVKGLQYQEWCDTLSQASLHAAASTAFPDLLDANLDPGSEDFPRYTVKFMSNGTLGNITQVGHADETSAILGRMDILQPRCGSRCSCPRKEVIVTTTTPVPEVLPEPDNITAPTPPPSGFNIIGGQNWWANKGWLPKTFDSPLHLSKMEVATYVTAFSFFVVVFFSASLICIYTVQRPPSRN